MSPVPRLVFAQMRDLPATWRARMRDLSFGAHEGTMWRWTYQNGYCWAVLAMNCHPPSKGYSSGDIAGWACWTEDDEPHPVVGVFVDPAHRGKGWGSQLARELLRDRGGRRCVGSPVYAVSRLWGGWVSSIKSAGFSHLEWE